MTKVSHKRRMRHRKSFLLIALVSSTLAFTAGFSGCKTPGTPTDPAATNAPPDPATINSIAVVLRGAARGGATVAISDNPDNAKYFQLAATAIGQFATGKDVSPGAFQTALMNVGIPDNQWVKLGVGTVVDLYQFYYINYVKDAVANDAKAFLTAVQDGFNEALGNPVTARTARAQPAIVLPRPIQRK